MIIDFSTHISTPGVLDFFEKKLGTNKVLQQQVFSHHSLEKRIQLMDKYGIDKHILSLSPPSIGQFGSRDASYVCTISDEGISEICSKWPERFIGFSTISLLDVRSAIRQLERGVKDLGLKGVLLSSNQHGKGLDSKEYDQFYERVVDFDIPIFLHPTSWQRYPLVEDRTSMMIFGWPFDTTQAAWRLIAGGVLDKFSSLKIVMHHLGAMIPYFRGRFDSWAPQVKTLKRPVSQYWRNFYGDTALDGSADAFVCGYSFFGEDRVVFGTDYPFGPKKGEKFLAENLNAVKKARIPRDAKEKIFSTNTKKLLKLE